MDNKFNNNNVNASKQIKIGAIMSYIAIIFNIVAGLLYTPWMVQQIGKSNYGLYVLASSVISFFLMDFGISGAISRFISLYRAHNEEENIPKLLGLTYKIYLIIDILIFLVLAIIFCFMNSIFTGLTPLEIEKFRIIFVIVGCFSLISFPFMPLNGVMISYERFIALKVLELFQKISSIAITVLALYLGYGLYTLVLVNALANIITISMKLIYLKRYVHLKKIDLEYKNPILLKQILSFSVWITVSSIAQRLIININPSILGRFSGAIQISVFSIGASLEGYVWTFANALNGLFLTKVTKLVVQDQKTTEVTNLMIKVGRIQLAIIGMILIGFFTMGKEFLNLWMGKDFEKSYYVALFLLLPSIVILTQEIAYNYMVAINDMKYRAYDFIGTALISILISVALTPKWGAIGAAFGAGIGIFVGHVVAMNLMYWKIFHLDIPRFFKECHLKMSVPLILSTLIGFVLHAFFPTNSLLFFAGKCGLFAICYSILMWIWGLNTYEKNLFIDMIKFAQNKMLKLKRR